jgi:type IV pilus assembly protein PilO
MAIGANMTKNEQMMVAVATIALLLAGAYWYFMYQPERENLLAVATRVDTLEARNRQARVDMARGTAEQFATEAAAYEQNLKLMRMLVPTSNEVPVLIEDVSTAARRVGLDLAKIEPNPVIPGEQFDTYRYNLGVVGGYHAISQFLSNIGSLNRIMAPDGVTLKVTTDKAAPPGAKKKGMTPIAPTTKVEATFQVQTYVTRTTPLLLAKGDR